MLLALVVTFGAMCVHTGCSMASANKAFRAVKANSLQGLTRLLAVILWVAAGGMILALLVPVAVYGAKVGWSLDRDAMAEKREKALGWHIVAASVLGCVASAVMIAIVT
jgi:ABC-type Fe3+ transport system permease subunit